MNQSTLAEILNEALMDELRNEILDAYHQGGS